MNYELFPTVNEILLNRQDLRECKLTGRYDFSTTPFKKGDIVEFMFNGLKKIGRITTIFRKGGMHLYNIETKTHQWFQKIEQEDIISKLK